MKKVLALCFILVMVFANVGFASKSKFKDSNYDFHNMRNFYLSNILYKSGVMPENFREDSNPTNRVLNALHNAFIKQGKQLLTQPDDMNYTNVDLEVIVYCLGINKHWQEPYYEDVYENEKVVRKDSSGKEVTWKVPRHRTVYHPGKWIFDAYAEIEFNLIDRDTGKVIYNLRDDRKRDNSDSYDGMLNRICNDFIKDLNK